MGNLRLSLTDALCRRAEPEAVEYALHDIGRPGLALRVQPCGARSWIVRLRIDDRQVKRSLGAFPEIGVKAARERANAVLARDAEPPPALRASPLFETFQAEHDARHAAGLKPSGLRTYRSYVHNQLLPAFAGKRLAAITRTDVIRWFERYSAKSPGGANRALGILGEMLARARDWGHLPHDWANPVTGVRHNRRTVVGTFLSDAQMADLGACLDARIRAGCVASSLLRFLTLTGCRVGEAINLEWRDVLSDRLTLRDSKTGAREVILGAPARRFLKTHRAGLARRASRAVFPLPVGRPYEAVRSVWLTVRRDAGLPDSLRIHDLRHSFASHAVMSGESLLVTSRLLGHRQLQTTARYAHLADHALIDTAERIGALIMAQAAQR